MSNMTDESKLKKPLLYGVIGSIALGAALGILLVLRDTWGWFEIRVILTTLVIAAASLCGLACDVSRIPRAPNVLSKLGMALSGIAATLMLAGIWMDIDSEKFWKATLCTSIFAVATVHVCLISIARLATRFQWIQFIGVQIIYGFALLLCVAILGEIDSVEVWRLIAATSVLIAAFSLSIPLLHRISKMDGDGRVIHSPVEERNLAAIDDEIVRLQKRIDELQRTRGSLMAVHPVIASKPLQPN